MIFINDAQRRAVFANIDDKYSLASVLRKKREKGGKWTTPELRVIRTVEEVPDKMDKDLMEEHIRFILENNVNTPHSRALLKTLVNKRSSLLKGELGDLLYQIVRNRRAREPWMDVFEAEYPFDKGKAVRSLEFRRKHFMDPIDERKFDWLVKHSFKEIEKEAIEEAKLKRTRDALNSIEVEPRITDVKNLPLEIERYKAALKKLREIDDNRKKK